MAANCAPSLENRQKREIDTQNIMNNINEAGETVKKTFDQYGKPVQEALVETGKHYWNEGVKFVNDEKTKETINEGIRETGNWLSGAGETVKNTWNSWFD